MSHLHRHFELVRWREYSLLQSRERHDRVAILFELRWRDVAFAFPKRIEQADERRALAGVIVQIQQLKTREAGRAQVGFDFFLVTLQLQATGCLRKFMVLRQHAVRGGGVAEDFKITRLHNTGKFLEDGKIGIRAPLPKFVRDDRHINAA